MFVNDCACMMGPCNAYRNSLTHTQSSAHRHKCSWTKSSLPAEQCTPHKCLGGIWGVGIPMIFHAVFTKLRIWSLNLIKGCTLR